MGGWIRNIEFYILCILYYILYIKYMPYVPHICHVSHNLRRIDASHVPYEIHTFNLIIYIKYSLYRVHILCILYYI